MTVKIGSLCSGAGGLDLAVAALYSDAEVVWFSEVDEHAAAVFQSHHPDAVNLGDLTTIDWSDVDPVDVLAAGFPCQDISHAGKQAGIKEGTRSGLWFNVAEAIRVLRPEYVYLENVAAIAYKNGPIDIVLGSLAAIGFDAEWGLLRASEVGACHQRRRWFCLAWPADRDSQRAQVQVAGQHPAVQVSGSDGATRRVPDKVGPLLPTVTFQWAARNATSGRQPDAVFNTGTTLSDVVYLDSWGEYQEAIDQQVEFFGPHPNPTIINKNTEAGVSLSPEFTEWMMGWPLGWTKVAGASTSKRIQMCGNGVVPHQALSAYLQLHERAKG